MCEKSKTDFAPIVTRLLFLKGHSPGIVPSTYLSRTKLLRRRKRSGSLLPSSSSSPPSTTTGGFLQNGVAAAGRASGATAASGVPSAEGSSTAEVASAGKVGRMFTASSEVSGAAGDTCSSGIVLYGCNLSKEECYGRGQLRF